MKTVILDAGHGGIINGVYQTPGKRSVKWDNGAQLFEGEFNRAIKARIIELCELNGFNWYDLNPEQTDTPLKERVNRANKINNSFLISIHANAGGGTGCEVFISKSASATSKKIALYAEQKYKKVFPGYKWRGIKKENFTIIHNTIMPAVLFECFFMDNISECNEILLTLQGRNKCAQWIYKTIEKTFKNF